MTDPTSDPRAALSAASEQFRALQQIVAGFGEAQTMIRNVAGDIRFWSHGAERLYGWSHDEAVGRSAHQLLSTEFPTDLASINHRLRRERFWQGELVHSHRNGSRVHVASHWMLQDSDDPWVVAVDNDITERHRIEATLRHHAALVADSDDAIIAKTLDGQVTSWNRAAETMFGWSAADMLGRPITTIIPPDKLDDEEAIIARLRAGERVDHFETVRQHRDGRLVQVSLTVSPIRDGRGTVVGASKIARDITRQRQTEMMLQRARRMTALGELTGGVAHDFNNLLSVIVNNMELLRRMLPASPEIDAMAEDILSAAHSGGALTRRLLTFARQQALTFEVIDLNLYMPSYVDLLRRTLGEAISIEARFADTLWPVRADASQIGDALINLALNARDALPLSGGRITIETGHQERPLPQAPETTAPFVTITVTDNGAGMAPEVLERALEPFFTTKPLGQGNGLGLSMVHGTVTQHGGFVEISSTPGEGTRVALFLPRAESEPAPASSLPQHPEPAPAQGEWVMVVDDNAQLRKTVLRSLTAMGYRTIEAPDALGCLAMLEGETPCDLLFTDVVMPDGITGPELARLARRIRPGLRVLLTTGFSSTVQGGEIEAPFEVLHKPYRLNSLATAVREALARPVGSDEK